jgi:hypothetical protein
VLVPEGNERMERRRMSLQLVGESHPGEAHAGGPCNGSQSHGDSPDGASDNLNGAEELVGASGVFDNY